MNVECYRRRWPTFGEEDLSKQNKGCSISEVEVFLHKYQHADTLFFNYCVVFFPIVINCWWSASGLSQQPAPVSLLFPSY